MILKKVDTAKSLFQSARQKAPQLIAILQVSSRLPPLRVSYSSVRHHTRGFISRELAICREWLPELLSDITHDKFFERGF
jgi:hypothetical protein